MWDFTHFWYLFCVNLHIFHTWVHNYGTKVLKIKQRNKLPHVLYITFNLLYHIHEVKSGEEWWKVSKHSSPPESPVFIGVSGEKVKGEE